MVPLVEQALRPSPARFRIPLAVPTWETWVRWLAPGLVAAAIAVTATGLAWSVAGLILLAVGVLSLSVGTFIFVRRLASANSALVEELEAFRVQERAIIDHAASVAHDIRSPLMTVRSYVEMMADDAFGPLPAAAREAALRAAQASSRAQSVVESALQRTTLCVAEESETRPLADLNAVLDDVVNSLSVELHRVGARIRISALPRLPGDESAYYRIFENLVQNAVRYHRPGVSPRVEVAAAVIEGRAVISVRDWGIGIAPADRERVFGVGVRGAVAAERADGRGLGLPTVRRLMEEMGGEATIDADVDDGTCVRLEFPCC